MQTTPDRHTSMEKLVVFMLLGLFLLLSMLLVLLGAKAYKADIVRTEADNVDRVMNAYIRSAIRSEDNADSISVLDADGQSVIFVRYGWEDDAYGRYIFCADGKLREKYQELSRAFTRSGGEEICDADALTVEMTNGSMRVFLTAPDGTVHENLIALYTPQTDGEGDLP